MRITGWAAMTAVCAMATGFAGAAEPSGTALFGKHCASCHGKDGKGNPKMAKMFKVEPVVLDLTTGATPKLPDADLVKIITAGKGKKMPAFAKKMTAAQIQDVAAAVRALAAPPK